jgi:hypothetical protein
MGRTEEEAGANGDVDGATQQNEAREDHAAA